MLTESQLQRRKSGIGGTDVAPIVGKSPYKTALDIYYDKTGQNDDMLFNNETVYWGQQLEPMLRKEFEKRTGKKVKATESTFVHPDEPCLIANVDGVLMNEDAILEIKTCGNYSDSRWGKEGSADIPEEYLCQVYHYLTVLQKQRAYVAVLIGGQSFKIYCVDANEARQNALKDKCAQFWKRYIINKQPPDPMSMSDLLSLYPGDDAETMTADNELVTDVMELANVKEQIKELKKQQESIEFSIKESMKDASALYDIQGRKLVDYKPVKSARLDTKKLKSQAPEVYEKFVTETESRRFTLKNVQFD